MLHSIPLDRIPHYPSHLATTSHESADGASDDGTTPTLRSLAHITPEHRAALVEAIVPDLEKWSAPGSSLDAARMLAEEGAYAVVTGQQAGIATGQLYTLYKALGTVRMAAELSRQHSDARFVPVFWIEADDHDFEEIRKVSVIDRTGVARSIGYDDNDSRPLHVGDRAVVAESFEQFLASIEETLAPTDFTAETLALLRAAYLGNGSEPSPTLADGFARALYAILGETPLVLVSSRNPALKRLGASALVREAQNPDTLFDSLTSRTEHLRSNGAQTPITPKRGALFLTHDGERRALDLDGNDVAVRGSDRRYTREELVALAESTPERLSPNVALRPLVQDTILPTAIYLGGPSEVVYLDQVHDAYRLFEQEPPQVGPRPFVLLLEPKTSRVIEGSQFTLEQIIHPEFNPATALVDAAVVERIDSLQASVAEKLQEAFGSFEPLTVSIDPTLEKTLGAAAASATKGLEDFTKRLRAALRKREQTSINRIEGARELLLPGGELQERVLSPIYYINKYGIESFRAALEKIELAPGQLQVIAIGER